MNLIYQHQVVFSRGFTVTDTRLSGSSGSYQTRFVNDNDYRAQEFPFGVSTSIRNSNLKIRQR
jgi:hypothetical protein